MIELGKVQKLRVVKLTEFGAYLGENDMEKVLPKLFQLARCGYTNPKYISLIKIFVALDTEKRVHIFDVDLNKANCEFKLTEADDGTMLFFTWLKFITVLNPPRH